MIDTLDSWVSKRVQNRTPLMKEWMQQSGDSFQSLLELRPELYKKYQDFLSAIENNDAVPTHVYELCRHRIQFIHGLADNDVATDNLDEAALAALVVADRMPYQHHQLADDEVASVKSFFGDEGCVALLTALAFFDVTARLDASFQMGNQ